MSHGAGDRELLVLAVVVMVVVIWRVLPSVDAVELLAWLPGGKIGDLPVHGTSSKLQGLEPKADRF